MEHNVISIVKRVETSLVEALKPALDARLADYEARADMVLRIRVTNQASMQVADQLLNEVLKEKDGLEEVRKSGPGALHVVVRTLNAMFKPLSESLEAMEDHLKQQNGAYVIGERRKQEQAYRTAAAAHVAGAHDVAAANLAVASSAETQASQGTSAREVWVVATIDPTQVPREWMIPDEKRIAAHGLNTKPDVEPVGIPGVVFVKQIRVAKRRK